MSINALRIVTLVALLTRCLACDDSKCFQLCSVELVPMVMLTLVLLARVKVAAAAAYVVLIARFQFLDALDFFAVVFELLVQALTFSVL